MQQSLPDFMASKTQPLQPMNTLPGMPAGGAAGATPTQFDGLGQALHGFTGVGGMQDAAGLSEGPSARENWNNGHPVIAGLQASSALPVIGGIGHMMAGAFKAGGPLLAMAAMPGKGAKAAKAAKPLGYDPAALATRYPERLPGEMMTDKKTGKEYLGKVESPEANAVMKVRAAAQKDINAGNYTPYFDPSQRFHVDAADYPLEGNTITDARPKKQDTIDQYNARFNSPEVRARLHERVASVRDNPDAVDWYAMGQLEQEYRRVLGDEAGRSAFKQDFAQGMAATTGGMDPTSNLLMTHYANFTRENGQQLPTAAHELHSPIGGRYASGNLDQYNKIINEGGGLTAADNPKRFDFAGSFMGHKNVATIDEQMMGIIDPGGKGVPPKIGYSAAEQAVHDVANELGLDPMTVQELGWFGQKKLTDKKGTSKPKPMISHVNEAIERTHRVTGVDRQKILEEGIIRKKMPLYGLGAGAAVPLMAQGQGEDQPL